MVLLWFKPFGLSWVNYCLPVSVIEKNIHWWSATHPFKGLATEYKTVAGTFASTIGSSLLCFSRNFVGPVMGSPWMNMILPVPIYYLVEPDFKGLVMESMTRVCFSFFSIRFHSWVLKLGSSFFLIIRLHCFFLFCRRSVHCVVNRSTCRDLFFFTITNLHEMP